MARYAAATSVSVEKSKVEIEATLTRYGATGFVSGWQDNQAFLGFVIAERQVKFRMTLPDRTSKDFCQYRRGGSTYAREPKAALALWEQACRQKWRALALVIKAKLEAVDAGISVIEDEFLANIVLPDGRVIGDVIKAEIAIAYQGGSASKLLPDYSS